MHSTEKRKVTRPPSKPRLTLRVGIIGHRARAPEIEADQSYISSLTSVLKVIQNGVVEFLMDHDVRDCFDVKLTPQIRISTGIAYGTDRWAQAATKAVKAATQEGDCEWRLELISPAPLGVAAAWAYADAGKVGCADYAAAWDTMTEDADIVTALEARWRSLPATSTSQTHPLPLPDGFSCQSLFTTYSDPPDGANSLSYAHAADFQLRQCDMVIAVWDGLGSRGPGGTADIAAKAKRLGMPVIWIDWKNPQKEAHFIERIDTDEAIPPIDGWIEVSGRPIAETPAIDGRIQDVLRHTLMPSFDESQDHGHGHDHHGTKVDAATYFSETPSEYEPPGAYARMVSLFSQGVGAWASSLVKRLSKPGATLTAKLKLWERRKAPSVHWALSAWQEFVTGNPDEGNQKAPLEGMLWNRFSEADQLAVEYAARYRSAFVRSYLLSACAVLTALLGLVLSDVLSPEIKAMLVVAELAVLLGIYVMVRDGQREHYHAKLVEYRALAEGLRHQAWLATFGEFALPVTQEARQKWVNWYLRATSREIGPPEGTLDASFQSSLIEAILKFEIIPQIAYHQSNSKKMHAVNHGLHSTGDRLFGATSIILAIFLILYLVKILHLSHLIGPGFETPLKYLLDQIKPWVGFFAAFLPTLGSALAGIRFTGDFEGKAAQSEMMAAALDGFKTRGEELKVRCDWMSTRTFLLDLEALLSEDVAQFHSNYGRQPLALPA
jgi:hypothetical protein